MSDKKDAKDKLKEFQRILDKFESNVTLSFVKYKENGDRYISFDFSIKGYGFGEIGILQKKDGRVFINSEMSEKETVMSIFAFFIKNAIFDWEKDPKKHRQYNEEMGVYTCGCGCGWSKPFPDDEHRSIPQ